MARLSALFRKSEKPAYPVHLEVDTELPGGGSSYSQSKDAGEDLLPLLVNELESLYWTGVNEEIDGIVATLQQWQRPKFNHIKYDETKDSIDGFDTFIQQVLQPVKVDNIPSVPSNTSYHGDVVQERLKQSLHARAAELAAERTRSKVTLAVHKELNGRPRETDTTRRRARLLLQGAGFLDIDKAILHRPVKTATILTPQLQLTKRRVRTCPVIAGMACMKCKQVIRGSMFEQLQGKMIICEDCYWTSHYGDLSYVKRCKHSITDKITAFALNHGRCRRCRREQQKDQRPNHIASRQALPLITNAMYESIHATKTGVLRTQPVPLAKLISDDFIKNPQPSMLSPGHADFEYCVTGEERLYKDFVQKDVWKDVNMVVRIGPLVIQRSMEERRNGAVITTRDPIFRAENRQDKLHITLLDKSPRRLECQTKPHPQKPARYQAILKQVVGIPFTRWPLAPEEEAIIDTLVKATDVGGSCSELKDKIKQYLQPWVSVYLRTIAERLRDEKVRLANSAADNCVKFCDSLLDWNLFGPLFSKHPVTCADGTYRPLYRMSFLTRSGALSSNPFDIPLSVRKVPYGRTEEYLRRFNFGCYGGPDLIDSLHEYWLDWAGIDKPSYPRDDLFPWDCTEALHGYPVTCGDCTLSRHLWAFPFDSWSIIALHLSREQCTYPDRIDFPETAWVKHQIKLLTALDSLCAGATAMSNIPYFHNRTEWLHAQSDPTVDRVKLGGIHRAQPGSHALEQRTHDAFFAADWITYFPRDRVKYYETIRNRRAAPSQPREVPRILWRGGGGRGGGGSGSSNSPPASVSVYPVQERDCPNAMFLASVTIIAGCGACGTQSSAAACAANTGADCAAVHTSGGGGGSNDNHGGTSYGGPGCSGGGGGGGGSGSGGGGGGCGGGSSSGGGGGCGGGSGGGGGCGGS